MNLITSFATSMYGSCTWFLFSKSCEKIHKSWNVLIRIVFNLDRKTHRSLIQPVSETCHLKTMLLSRFFKFYKTLETSEMFPVRFMAKLNQFDKRTVLGLNLSNLEDECNSSLDLLTSRNIKERHFYKTPMEDDEWRLPLIQDILQLREDKVSIDGFTKDETEEIINFACVS